MGKLGSACACSIRRFFRCVLLLFAISIGIVQGAGADIQTGLVISHNGLNRTYDLYIPDDQGSAKLPLVLDLHGATLTSGFQRLSSGVLEIAMEEQFFVAWPNGRNRRWNAYPDNQPPLIGMNDDVGFIRALVSEVVANHAIDQRRVYVTGFSEGGAMTYRLACEASDIFAAVSGIAPGFKQGTTGLCQPTRDIPVFTTHGLTDPLVPYEGGFGGVPGEEIMLLSAADLLQFWRQKNSCIGPVSRQNLGSDSFCDSDNNCTDGLSIQFCAVIGIGFDGHLVYQNTDGLDLAQMTWDFFELHSLPATAFGINAGLNDSWFNPATLGQGFFITVFEDLGAIFLAWFTYDTERPGDEVTAILGEPGHRWLTAFGTYEGDSAVLDVELTSGGIFDATLPAPSQSPDGTITLQFDDCESGTVSYDLDSIGMQGEIPIQRIANDNVGLCESP